MWVIGHRGAAGKWPENTLLAIKQALAYGADWIEIDIRMVEDTIIVLHDETLDRTTNGSGSVYEHSLEDLRKLDAGNGERIALLTEVLDTIDGQVGLNIEIKQRGTVQALIALTDDYLQRQPKWCNQLMLSSFLPEVMLDLAAIAPPGRLLGALSEANSEEALQFATCLNAFSLNVSLAQLSASLVEQAHDRGLKVLVYTVNEVPDIRRCFELSVDGIFTDFPERSIAFLSNSPIIPEKLR